MGTRELLDGFSTIGQSGTRAIVDEAAPVLQPKAEEPSLPLPEKFSSWNLLQKSRYLDYAYKNLYGNIDSTEKKIDYLKKTHGALPPVDEIAESPDFKMMSDDEKKAFADFYFSNFVKPFAINEEDYRKAEGLIYSNIFPDGDVLSPRAQAEKEADEYYSVTNVMKGMDRGIRKKNQELADTLEDTPLGSLTKLSKSLDVAFDNVQGVEHGVDSEAVESPAFDEAEVDPVNAGPQPVDTSFLSRFKVVANTPNGLPILSYKDYGIDEKLKAAKKFDKRFNIAEIEVDEKGRPKFKPNSLTEAEALREENFSLLPKEKERLRGKLLSQGLFSPSELSFLLSRNEKGDYNYKTIFEPKEYDYVLEAIDRSREVYGDPESSLDAFKSSMGFSGLDEPVEPVGFGPQAAGFIGGFGKRLLPAMAAGAVGSAAGGVPGLVAGLFAGAFSTEMISEVMEAKRRGRLHKNFKTYEEMDKFLAEAVKHSAVTGALASVPVAAGMGLTVGMKGASRVIAAEGIEAVSGLALERGLTGENTLEGLLMSTVPTVGIHGGGALAKGAIRGVRKKNVSARIDDLLDSVSRMRVAKDGEEGLVSILKGEMTDLEKAELGIAVVIDSDVKKTSTSKKVKKVKEAVDEVDPEELIRNFGTATKENVEVLMKRVADRAGVNVSELMEIYGDMVDGYRAGASVPHDVITRKAKGRFDKARKELPNQGRDLDLKQTTPLENAVIKYYRSVEDNVLALGSEGKKMVDMVHKYEADLDLFTGKYRSRYMSARRSLDEIQKRVGKEDAQKIEVEMARYLDGETKSVQNIVKLLTGSKSMKSAEAKAVKAIADEFRTILDELGLIERKVGVTGVNSEAIGWKIEEDKKGFHRVVDINGNPVAGRKGVPKELTQGTKNIDTLKKMKRALAEYQYPPIELVKNYFPRLIDWDAIAKTATADEIINLIEGFSKSSDGRVVFEKEVLDVLKNAKKGETDPKASAKAMKQIRDGYLTKVMARVVEEKMAGLPIMSHQFSRGKKWIPSKFMVKDLGLIEKHIIDSGRVIKQHQHFGRGGSALYNQVFRIADEIASTHSDSGGEFFSTAKALEGNTQTNPSTALAGIYRAKLLADSVTGNLKEGNINPLASGAMAIAVYGKLATSFLGQMPQWTAGAYRGNLTSWAKAVGELTTDMFKHWSKREAIAKVHATGMFMSSARDQVLAGAFGNLRKLGWLSMDGAGKYLDFIQFTRGDFISRAIAIVTGRNYATDIVGQYTKALNSGKMGRAKKMESLIRELGIDEPLALVAEADGIYKPNLTEQDLLIMSRKFEIDTNFRNDFHKLPEFRHGTGPMLVTQFRTFMYHQTRLNNKILRSAMKDGSAVEAAFKMATFLGAMGISGAVVKEIRGLLAYGLTGEDTPLMEVMRGHKGFANYMLEVFSTAGALGLLEIPYGFIAHTDVNLGPVVSDLWKLSTKMKEAGESNDPITNLALSPFEVYLPGILSKSIRAAKRRRRGAIRDERSRLSGTLKPYRKTYRGKEELLRKAPMGFDKVVALTSDNTIMQNVFGAQSTEDRKRRITHTPAERNRIERDREKDRRARERTGSILNFFGRR